VNSAPHRFTSRADTIAFVACLLLSVGARAAPPQVQDSLASAIRATVLAPLLGLQQQAALVKGARARYGAVTAQRDSAVLVAQEVPALQEENQRLREVLSLAARLPRGHVSAEVLHQAAATDGFTLILGAGSEDGVRAMAPVVAAGGLVGVVRSVEPRTSVVMVWAHRDFRVSAMTLDGGVFGIVAPSGAAGPNTMLLELQGVPYRQDVAPGTVIYTSGLGGASGLYPRGIPIGRVLSVSEERAGWSRTFLVRPAVHPASVSHVIVLTARVADLGRAFGEAP
jgi:rod shape-determining protein MreC